MLEDEVRLTINMKDLTDSTVRPFIFYLLVYKNFGSKLNVGGRKKN